MEPAERKCHNLYKQPMDRDFVFTSSCHSPRSEAQSLPLGSKSI